MLLGDLLGHQYVEVVAHNLKKKREKRCLSRSTNGIHDFLLAEKQGSEWRATYLFFRVAKGGLRAFVVLEHDALQGG